MQTLSVVVLRIARHTHDKKQTSLLVLTREYGVIWILLSTYQAQKYGIDIGRLIQLRYTTKNNIQRYDIDHIRGEIFPPHFESYHETAHILILVALIAKVFPISLAVESIYDDIYFLYICARKPQKDSAYLYKKASERFLWRILGYISHDITPYIHPHHPHRERIIRCLKAGQIYTLERLICLEGVSDDLQRGLEELAHLYLFSSASHD